MTGDGWPDLAIGAPQADPGGRTDAGSVWIISGHLPPIGPGCSGMNVDATCPWIKLNGLTAAQGYRIDGALAGQGLGSALAGVGDQNGDGLPDIAIGASAASPGGRASAGEIVVMAGQAGSATHDTSSALQRIQGASAGAGSARRSQPAGDVDGDGRIDLLAGAPGEAGHAGAAYFVRLAPGTTADLAQGAFVSRIAPGRGRRADRQRGRRRARPGARRGTRRQRRGRRRVQRHGQRLAGARARRRARAARAGRDRSCAEATGRRPRRSASCARWKPARARYRIVGGKRVKVRPAPCRPRPKAVRSAARGGHARPV